MKAELNPNYDANRTELSDVVPLESPYTILIEVTRLCNYKCFYCLHSTREDAEGAYQKISLHQNFMDNKLFEKIAREISEMKVLPKRILLLGLGEPLLNQDLPWMISTLRAYGFDGRIDIVTNGSLMTHEIADRLVDAGTSKIIVSLQGITAEQYQENCGVKQNMDQLVERLTYLYEHRRNTQIYIKIIDALLKSQEERDLFFEIFGSICDTIYVEHLIVNQTQMGDHEGRVSQHQLNIFGEPILERAVCPMVFYQMQIFLDGTVLACPITATPIELAIGDANEKTLEEIWNGEKRRQLLTNMLDQTRFSFQTCSVCESIHCVSHVKENLDSVRENVLERMNQYYAVRD